MAAAGDDSAVARLRRNADEHRLEAEGADPQADLIILGHAAARERPAVLHRRQLGERAAGNGATDAGERDRRADRFAHDQLLDVRLGELIAIMAAIQRDCGSGSGITGSWITAARSISPSKIRNS